MHSYVLHVIESIKNRIAWYEKAVAISTGKLPRENHFDYPSSTHGWSNPASVWEWRGAIRELKNTLAMLEHAGAQSGNASETF